MMLRLVQSGMVLAALGGLLPHATQAQFLGRPVAHCGQPRPHCHSCQQVTQHCTCTTLRPVVETQYEQQQRVTYRDVTEVQYQTRMVTEKVPVTRYQNVTVDAGGYQMVWVPKLVNKQIPQTTYEERMACQVVPQQVTRRVPEVSTHLVPRQTVRYVPQQTQVVHHTPNCLTCDPVTGAVTPWIGSPQTPIPSMAQPASIGGGTHPTGTIVPTQVPQSGSRFQTGSPYSPAWNAPVGGPQLELSFQEAPTAGTSDEWTTIPSRSVPAPPAEEGDSLGQFDVFPSGTHQPASSSSSRPSTKRFVPAPSAASVWQTRQPSAR